MTDFAKPKPRHWTKSSVDNIAEKFANAFEIEPGDDLPPLIEDLGGEIVYGYNHIDEYQGGSIVVRATDDFTIVLSELTSAKRDRFTLAHELGHLFLHFEPLLQDDPNAVMRATRDKRVGDPEHERAEWEANWFAAGFLMPREKFISVAAKMSNSELATYFNVSDQAVEIRKKTLAIE